MKQFLILLGMCLTINAWSKDLYICDVTRFNGGGAEVMPGVEYKELHTFILKKGQRSRIQLLTVVKHNQRLLLTSSASISISSTASQTIRFKDENEDIYGDLNFYEEDKYFGQITVHEDFIFNVQCIKKQVRKGSVY